MQSSVAIINWYTKERPSSMLIDYNGSTGNEVAFEVKRIKKKSYRSPCTNVIKRVATSDTNWPTIMINSLQMCKRKCPKT